MRASMIMTALTALACLALYGGGAVAQVAPDASAPAVQSAEAPPVLSPRERAKAEKKAAKAREEAAAASDPDRIICKRTQTQDDAQEGGSRLGGQRTCLTRAQWADKAYQDQQVLIQMRNTGVNAH